MENKQQIMAVEQTPEEKINLHSEIFEMALKKSREKAIDEQIEGMSEQEKKNRNLVGEIIDCCYKAEEIAKAVSFLLVEPPEYKSFDPVPMIDAILDYVVQIDEYAQKMFITEQD